jgi:hypothetical protein
VPDVSGGLTVISTLLVLLPVQLVLLSVMVWPGKEKSLACMVLQSQYSEKRMLNCEAVGQLLAEAFKIVGGVTSVILTDEVSFLNWIVKPSFEPL